MASASLGSARTSRAGNEATLARIDRSLTYLYDNLNRVIRKTVPERAGLTAAQTRDVYYDYYHALGLQTKARFDGLDGEGVTTYYDEFGQPTTTLLAMNGSSRYVSYYYDDAGNLWRLTHPDGANFYHKYDALGRMTSVAESSTPANDDYIVRYAYTPTGPRSSALRGATSGFVTTATYDPINRPDTIANELPGTANDVSLTFAYNPASQIIRRTVSNDAYAAPPAYNVTRAYAVNGLNQYTAAGPSTFAYDANGNLTSDGTTTFTYDVENRLVSASNGAGLVYDPLGRLFQTSGGTAGTTQFLYDGDKMIAEYDGATLLKRYVHGPGADEPVAVYSGAALGTAGRRYMLADHQGSIAALLNANGTPSVVNRYDSWGIPGAANDGRFQYTGQAWIPELGMYHYKARIYSPTLGRFMQTDPVGYEDDINLYAYVGNDPTNRGDPTGKALELNGMKRDRAESIKISERATGLDLSRKDGHLVAAPARSGVTESVAAVTMRNAINSPANIVVNAVRNSATVFVDSAPTNEVDVGDIGAIQQKDANLGAAALTHVMEERTQMAQNRQSFAVAHQLGLRQEANVMGGGAVTRMDNGQIGPGQNFQMQYLDLSGNVTASYSWTNGANGTPQ